MTTKPIETERLRLVAQTRDEVRAWMNQLPPADRAEISAEWLALLDQSGTVDPWIHGFGIVLRETNTTIGRCGFKGPPGADGVVEIAYGLDAEHQGKGYATEAAAGLTGFAFAQEEVRVVRAHTLPQANASTRVLTKCGFHRVGEVIDPADGLVWRWERERPEGPRPAPDGIGEQGNS